MGTTQLPAVMLFHVLNKAINISACFNILLHSRDSPAKSADAEHESETTDQIAAFDRAVREWKQFFVLGSRWCRVNHLVHFGAYPWVIKMLGTIRVRKLAELLHASSWNVRWRRGNFEGLLHKFSTSRVSSCRSSSRAMASSCCRASVL